MTQRIPGESLVIHLERKATTTDGKLFIATSCSPIPCNNFVGIYFHVLDFPFSFLVFANQLVPHRMLDTCGSSVRDFTGLITLRCLRHKIHFTFHPFNCRLYFLILFHDGFIIWNGRAHGHHPIKTCSIRNRTRPAW